MKGLKNLEITSPKPSHPHNSKKPKNAPDYATKASTKIVPKITTPTPKLPVSNPLPRLPFQKSNPLPIAKTKILS
jgi:hypothetical protein